MRFITALYSLLIAGTLLQCVRSCNPTSVNVGLLSNPALTTAGIFGNVEVQNHANDIVILNSTDYRRNNKTTLSCVDARSDHPVVATPGGDLAEFTGALVTYFDVTGIEPTLDTIRTIFKRFLSQRISSRRPFYFHTDDSKLRQVFEVVSAKFGRRVTILPEVTPTNATEAGIWLEELTKSYAQGCGHVRLMIESFTEYGLDTPFIPQTVIRVFFEEFWKVEQKRKFDFVVYLGPLIGQAIAVVSNAGPACSDRSPAIQPSLLGSSMFVYHPAAAGSFRQAVLTPFFAQVRKSTGNRATLNTTEFLNSLNGLQGKQLGATLTLLAPPKDINLFSVAYTTSP
jgi:hypothetical protein